MAATKSKYRPECDVPVTRPILVHTSEGRVIKAPVEGGNTFAVLARSTWTVQEGQPKVFSVKVCVCSAYQAKKAAKQDKYLLRSKGAPTLGTVEAGTWVLGSGIKRFPEGGTGEAILKACLLVNKSLQTKETRAQALETLKASIGEHFADVAAAN